MTAYEFAQASNAYKEKKFVCVKLKKIIEIYLYRKRIFVGMKWIHMNQILILFNFNTDQYQYQWAKKACLSHYILILKFQNM